VGADLTIDESAVARDLGSTIAVVRSRLA